MHLEPFMGKRLTAISVFEPWRHSSGAQSTGLPLFGAIALEFEDMALLCKSSLRYSRIGGNACHTSLSLPHSTGPVSAGCSIIVCDTEQLVFHKRLLEGIAGGPLACRWNLVLPECRASLLLDNFPDLKRSLGEPLIGATRVSSAIMELRFARQDLPLRISYREYLDGAIQLARVGWNHQITEIVVSTPEHEFGWLHPEAPYPICAKAKQWPNIGRYIESATWEATRGESDRRSVSYDNLLAIHKEALRLKFERHRELARRFAAIRFPIVGDGLSDVAIQTLHRLRVSHSTIPAS